MMRTRLDHVWCSSPNFGDRLCDVDILLLHYTGMKSGAAAVNWLCTPESGVSCHYLVDIDGSITQMVSEDKRAWHAGKSYWQGNDDINSASVGVEIQNEGPLGAFPDFPDEQIEAVIALSKDIIARHNIPAKRVLAHSDVAPGRKVDPGPKFPWAKLAKAGVGYWPQDISLGRELSIKEIQRCLWTHGYDCHVSGEMDEETVRFLKSFQLRYGLEKVDGVADHATQHLLQNIGRK